MIFKIINAHFIFERKYMLTTGWSGLHDESRALLQSLGFSSGSSEPGSPLRQSPSPAPSPIKAQLKLKKRLVKINKILPPQLATVGSLTHDWTGLAPVALTSLNSLSALPPPLPRCWCSPGVCAWPYSSSTSSQLNSCSRMYHTDARNHFFFFFFQL